ncbi:ComEA family DNA-binding protein [Chitinophaga barathri]|uniref:ComEA family DNA-binding protein n=1 Tax=Chitinophaga barathri TaxID=1647451 RepID=UPI000F5027CE|nr:helix-hairpin-helix domain-containing protein [Chitinophaga barathri]
MPNQFFEFSRKERWGIACLLSLILLVQFLPSAWNTIFFKPPVADTAGLNRVATEVAALMESEREAAAIQYRTKWKDSSYRRDRWKNDAHYARSGFYRDDGRFDRRKFYRDSGRFPNGGYYTKRPYENRPYAARHNGAGNNSYANSYRYPDKRLPIPVIDINAADSAQWERLPGIGPTLAKRIVGFRDRLGGFYSTRQVGEVYGLVDSVFNKIQPFLRLGDVSLRKISLNDTDDKSLALHPYINTKLARVIVRYRSAHGPFREVETLRALALVDDSIYRKIEKYLKIN